MNFALLKIPQFDLYDLVVTSLVSGIRPKIASVLQKSPTLYFDVYKVWN